MKPATGRGQHGQHGEPAEVERPLALAALGLEAEFTLVVDGVPTKPEDLFGDPRGFLREPLMHRVGTSYHLPHGGAVYFDTGVVEVVTPAIELERGAAARAGRSLWEGIHYVRDEFNSWERRTGRRVLLTGFSTHYNISVRPLLPARRLDALAKLLTYILPAPVMLLAANRRSTGVGVRPRVTRIEVTCDFTPDAALQIATATFIAGVVREVAQWRSWRLPELRRRRLPRIAGFQPMPHTSRKGWLARADCYPHNPFEQGPDTPIWREHGSPVRDGSHRTLREIAQDVFMYFRGSIARLADPFSLRLISAVLDGRAASLLDLPDRPAAYDDAGRLCQWPGEMPARSLERSRYERILIHAIAGKPLQMDGEVYVPVGMRGWSRAVFRRQRDRLIQVFSIDSLLQHLDAWDR